MAIDFFMQKEKTARLLIENKALEFSLDRPFHYTSGLSGPLYCDNRRLLSLVNAREQIIQAFLEKIDHLNISFDLVAGLATGGIAYGALIANSLRSPFIYIRKKSKDHGTKKRIEGLWKSEDQIIIIEDLVNQGGSLLEMASVAKKAGMKVTACFCIVDYQMRRAKDMLKKEGFSLYSLTDFQAITDQALSLKKINNKEYQKLISWQQNQ